jgi:hypothetical protein
MTAFNVAEVAVIRNIADDIIKGRALYAIAKELNATGVPLPDTMEGQFRS